MKNNRIPKQIIVYKAREKKSLGRPMKRWHNTLSGLDNVTG
jgi:hypothetical protein